jgi:hypothetical protein
VASRAICDAYPDYEPLFGGHGDYGGHRAPRDHTISFRLRDEQGRFRSNVVWVLPDALASLTVEEVRRLVQRAGGGKH